MSAAPKTLATLALLTLALPINAAVTALALLVRRGHAAPAPGAKTILISGGKMTKALQLARCFHAAGHRVVLVEAAKYRCTGHRFSRAVDRFHTVPAPDAAGYAEALRAVARREGADVYVPVCSPLASRYDAEAGELMAGECETVHPDAETVRRLDDKFAFSRTAAALGLRVPGHHRITDPAQVEAFPFAEHPGRTWILKSLAYDPVRRMDLTRLPRPTPQATAAFAHALPISADNPWILQEFVEGREFCTHSTVRDGAVQLHCCCASSAFQLNYAMEEKPEIDAWVRRFVGALGVTGQLSFDFIEAADGHAYAIECNPRTHSAITLFHGHPGVARAYLESGVEEVRPLPTTRPTYWLYEELWRALRRPWSLPERVRTVARGRDAIFDASDPLPFLAVHHLQLPWLLLGNLVRGRPWVRLDFNIGKLVEPAGD